MSLKDKGEVVSMRTKVKDVFVCDYCGKEFERKYGSSQVRYRHFCNTHCSVEYGRKARRQKRAKNGRRGTE